VLLRWPERSDDEVVRACLDEAGEVGIVDADLLGDAVERLGEPAIVLIDARELSTP
jgi:hypothetical protein